MFDTAGVLSISVPIALFGFLTTRAWKLKTAILKGGGGIIAGLLALMLTTILILALVGFYKLNERFDKPIVNTQVTQGDSHLQRDCHPAIHATRSFVLTVIHPS